MGEAPEGTMDERAVDRSEAERVGFWMKAATFASSLIFLSKASTSFARASRSLGDFFKAAR